MKILLDRLSVEVKDKQTILEVARERGIDIPSLCDHPRLEPFAGCRLCLVDVKGMKGPVPA
ncbi:MAG TPA: 2Fe-2S iron-sulfur cluster-binding protein, partial [Acidobacteriota bacterium]|nr:2Fe-2S iron-sulfur cluster-binding protein [Acidobacteriota bacterium]